MDYQHFINYLRPTSPFIDCKIIEYSQSKICKVARTD